MNHKLDITNKNHWDEWRRLYNDLSDEEQIEYHNLLETKYPSQKAFNRDVYDEYFSELNYFINVLEIGSWKAELATHCLKTFPKISHWTSVEICTNAVNNTVCRDHTRHMYFTPSSFRWFNDENLSFLKKNIDICISSHTIEHLSDKDLKSLINFLAGIKTIIFEAPIREESGKDWKGYVGTHILSMGWNEISELMSHHGYKARKLNSICMIFEK